MEINRKKFVVGLGAIACAIVAKSLTDIIPKFGLAESSERNKNVRWALVVNLKACKSATDCKDCIKACHLTHNVPDINNPKEEVKWLWTVPFEKSFPDGNHDFIQKDIRNIPSLVLCNHCDNPPCVNVCPTKATFKREDGIVMMDYHRCIGCRYCMAACPYGSRSFNWRDPRPFIKNINPVFPTRTKGVVEKCNFCEERLADGLLPACVDACKNNALMFGDINDSNSKIRQQLNARYSIIRKPSLGTHPQIYYVV